MRNLLRILSCLLAASAFAAEPERKILGRSAEESYADKVVVLEVGQKDLVNRQSFAFYQRSLQRAEDEGARAVILEIDTPGGFAFDTRDLIVDELGKLKIPVFTWVQREAISAGALIAFATDEIYMAPGTIIGSAGLVSGTGQSIDPVMRAKLESVFEASMRTIVSKKGHRIDVLRAMMFIDEEEERTFGPVTVPKDGLLNLTAEEAVLTMEDGAPLLATGIAKSLEEVLEAENMADAEIVRAEPTGFERLAWWIAAFSPLLIAVGVGSAWIELKAPGFGIFGFVSLAAFGIFFFGNSVAGNLAGYELMAVFLLGMVLIILELFVLPGGIAGILGALMVLGSLWFAMADKVTFDRALEDGKVVENLDNLLLRPALMLGLGLAAALLAMFAVGRFLPQIPLLNSLIFKDALPSGAATDSGPRRSLVGATGQALTSLRPSGTVMVEGIKHDAVSRHGLIDKGQTIRVLEEGMTFVVEPARSPDKPKT
jgi:membrane-bound serine protease (ClpP class)